MPTPTLALLHGWGYGPAVWQASMPPLGFAPAVECWRLPGYGEPQLRCLEDGAMPLSSPTVCIGWSLGAMLLAACTQAAAEHLRGLILVAMNASFTVRADWPHAMPTTELAALESAVRSQPQDVAGTLRRFALTCTRGEPAARTVARALQAQVAHDPLPDSATLMHGLAQLRALDLRPALAALRVPTLLIHGECDPLVPTTAGAAIGALNPLLELTTIADAGHAPFVSAPQAFIDCVRKFLRRL